MLIKGYFVHVESLLRILPLYHKTTNFLFIYFLRNDVIFFCFYTFVSWVTHNES